MLKFSGYKFIPSLIDYGFKNDNYYEKWAIFLSTWEHSYYKKINLPFYKKGLNNFLISNEIQIKGEI